MNSVIIETELEGLDPTLHKSLRNAILRQKRGQSVVETEKIEDYSKVSQEALSALFAEKLQGLDLEFQEGTIAFVRKKFPNLYKQTNDADSKLSRIWSMCLSSELGIHDFKEALNEWYLAYWRCAEAMRKNNNLREGNEYGE